MVVNSPNSGRAVQPSKPWTQAPDAQSHPLFSSSLRQDGSSEKGRIRPIARSAAVSDSHLKMTSIPFFIIDADFLRLPARSGYQAVPSSFVRPMNSPCLAARRELTQRWQGFVLLLASALCLTSFAEAPRLAAKGPNLTKVPKPYQISRCLAYR